MATYKNKAVGGVFWTGIETVGQYLIQFIITIILARTLSPRDFGTIEMLLIFTALSNVILDSGFSQALIRKKDVTSEEFSSVFYFNIGVGIALYSILFFSAPLIASFFRTPELVNVSRVIFLSIIVNSFSIIHTTIITTELNFKILTRSSIIAALLSAIVGISLAKFGYGVWSLVYQTISFALIKSIILWISNKWRPSLTFDFVIIKNLFKFSSRLLLVGILDVFFTNIQTLVIGKMYSRIELGYYSQAKRFQSVPSNSLTLIVQKVTYPILSKIKDDDLRLKNNYSKIIQITMFIVCPLMLSLAAIGDRLFLVVLTEKWLPAVLYFKLLCLVGVLFPLYSINLNIIAAKGRGDLYLKVGIYKRVVVLASILSTVWFGVLYLVIGQVIATFLNSIITMHYSGKLINYPIRTQIGDIGGIFCISCLVALSIYFLGESVEGFDYFVLSSQVIIAITSYFLLSKFIKSQPLEEILIIYKSLRKKIKRK